MSQSSIVKTNNESSVEWYTPEHVIEHARAVLGEIDLDPASCKEANNIVRAKKYFSKEDNGLSQEWYGKVWLNPPYSAGGTEKWVKRIVDDYEDGVIIKGMLLVNANLSTRWFQHLWGYHICFPTKRIKFVGQGSSPISSNAIVLISKDKKDIDKFIKEFSALGAIVKCVS